ncbi:peptidylprolyl isomerase [Hydrogenimonas sp.]
MRRISALFFAVCILVATAATAGLVDAISIVVDDQPITLYEIYKAQKQRGLTKQQAVEALIKERLKDEELKRLGIHIDDFDVNQEIERIAQKNGMDSLKMRSILAERGIDWDAYKQQVKDRLLQERLYEQILSTKIQPPSDKTLKEYYRLHINEFSIPEAIRVIQYSAPTKEALERVMENPMAQAPGVTRQPQRLEAQRLNPQLFMMLTRTPKGSFTQILPVGGQFVTFFVQEFENPKPIPFEKVKQQVYAKWMEQKRKEAIESHFEKLRAAANVRVLRAP